LQLHIFCAAIAFLTLSRAAEARPTPEPKPSGIVVHLFGPDSVTTHVLSAEPTAAGRTMTKPASAAQDPSFGGILHQMFVAGDPAQKPGAAFAKGRASDQPGH
jgi:hypothetical protein